MISIINVADFHNLGVTNGANQIVVTWPFDLIDDQAAVAYAFYRGASGLLSSVVDEAGNLYGDHGGGDLSRLGNGNLSVRGVSGIVGGVTPDITFQFSAAQIDVDVYLAQYAGVDPTTMFGAWGRATSNSGTVITSSTFTPGIAEGAVGSFAVTNDTDGSVGTIGGVAATGRIIPSGWATVIQDRIFSSDPGASITATSNMSSSYTLGAILAFTLNGTGGGGGDQPARRRLGGVKSHARKRSVNVFRDGFKYSPRRRIFLPSYSF